jgi:type II secretory pathway pseudopilin PulG
MMKDGFGLKRACILSIACLMLLPVTAWSQQRRRTTKRSTRAATTQNRTDSVREGANRVNEKIKVLTRFLYLLGRVSSGIETADEMARRNETSQAAIERTQQSKAEVKATLRNVREGLDELEIHFRTTPELQRYYIRLAGVAAGAATAEEQAGANQFDRAGRSLLEVVNRLADVLLEMR